MVSRVHKCVTCFLSTFHHLCTVFPKHLGVEGVPAEEHRLVTVLDEGGRYLWRLQPVAQGLPPSGDSLLCQHLHYHGAASEHPALGEGEGLLQRRGQHVGHNVDDLHPCDSLPSSGCALRNCVQHIIGGIPHLLHRGRPLWCQSRVTRP